MNQTAAGNYFNNTQYWENQKTDECGALDLVVPKNSKTTETANIPLTVLHCYYSENSNVNEVPTQPNSKRRRVSERSTSDSTWSSPDNHVSAKNFAKEELAPTNMHAPPISIPMMVSNSALAQIFRYNESMVRKHPNKERTPKEQERRDKNTIACRISRCKEKLKNLAIEEQYKVFSQQHLDITKQIMREAAYLNELLRYAVITRPHERNSEIIEMCAEKLQLHFLKTLPTLTRKQNEHQPNKASPKRSFTVAFLLGME